MCTYFYNKFRPVNHMCYINCGVNSSLHNSGCCIRSVAPWITVLSCHTIFTKRVIYYIFTFVWYSAKQGTMHRPVSHLAHCALSLAARRTQMAEQLGWFRSREKNTDGRAVGLISQAIVCYGYLCGGWLLLLLLSSSPSSSSSSK